MSGLSNLIFPGIFFQSSLAISSRVFLGIFNSTCIFLVFLFQPYSLKVLSFRYI